MLEYEVKRLAGHPWDGQHRPNFDMLEVRATSRQELDKFIERAMSKFWEIWIAGIVPDAEPPFAFGGLLYKPTGIKSKWTDEPKHPHPGGSIQP